MGDGAYTGTFRHFLYCVLLCSEQRDKAHRRRSARRQGHDEPLCETGVPIAIQNGLISVSMVALQRVTNGFGETVMATYTVSMRIEQFVQQPFSSLNAAVSTFTGQNIGAGKEKRAQKGLACAIKISVIFSAVVLVLFTLFGGAITSWFVKGKTVISISAKALIITSLFYWSLGIIHTTRGF